MSLDTTTPPDPDTLTQYGRDEVLERFEALAKSEAVNGDGRALRLLNRLIEACGYAKGGRHG